MTCKRKTWNKFWEQLSTYFLVIRHGPHRVWRVQQFYCCMCTCCHGTCLPSRCLAMTATLCLQLSGFCTLLVYAMLCSQSQRADTWELETLITELLYSNSHLNGSSLTALFQVSGVVSHATYTCIWYCNGCLFWLHYSGFQESGGGDQTHKQQDDLISLLLVIYLFQNKERG
jgi:hypothetical protein